MSLHIEAALLRLLDPEHDWTPNEVAWELWGKDATPVCAQSVRGAMLSLLQQGLLRRGGRRYYALELDEVYEDLSA